MLERREFLAQFPVAAAALTTLDLAELHAGTTGDWDLSWIDRIPKAKYPVAWNAFEVNDGMVLELVRFFKDHYHEVHNTTDRDTLPVVVFRKVGTAPVYDDAMWEKYGIGEVEKVNDPATGTAARKNIFRPAIADLVQRGMIPLVCNVALGFYARKLAAKTGGNATDVANELRANLLPGAILVPSGIYALTRAQHAGCVYMLGS